MNTDKWSFFKLARDEWWSNRTTSGKVIWVWIWPFVLFLGLMFALLETMDRWGRKS